MLALSFGKSGSPGLFEGENDVSHVLVMGVCGCGKSVVSRALADELGATFIEGDAFHPPANIESMKAGHPLSDEMRFGWLDAIGDAVSALPGRAVIACSALKKSYRERLRLKIGEMQIVHLTGNRALLQQRVGQRQDHFMPVSLVDSQFAILESPVGSNTVAVDVELPLDIVVETALTFLHDAEAHTNI